MHRPFLLGGSSEGYADGTYWTGKLTVDLAFATPDGSEGDGEVQAQTAGRWSAEAGALNLCQDRLVFGGTVTMTSRMAKRSRGLFPRQRRRKSLRWSIHAQILRWKHAFRSQAFPRRWKRSTSALTVLWAAALEGLRREGEVSNGRRYGEPSFAANGAARYLRCIAEPASCHACIRVDLCLPGAGCRTHFHVAPGAPPRPRRPVRG